MSAGRAAVRRRQVRTGFTLAELVMSIAVLALAGVFLAQVFLSADRIATKASDLDRAVSLGTTVVEQWKASADPRAIDGLLTFPESTFQVETPGDTLLPRILSSPVLCNISLPYLPALAP